jgi:hypothetical protein
VSRNCTITFPNSPADSTFGSSSGRRRFGIALDPRRRIMRQSKFRQLVRHHHPQHHQRPVHRGRRGPAGEPGLPFAHVRVHQAIEKEIAQIGTADSASSPGGSRSTNRLTTAKRSTARPRVSSSASRPRPTRLTSVSAQNLVPAAPPQMGLFAPAPRPTDALNRALDAITSRFGAAAITTGDVAATGHDDPELRAPAPTDIGRRKS